MVRKIVTAKDWEWILDALEGEIKESEHWMKYAIEQVRYGERLTKKESPEAWRKYIKKVKGILARAKRMKVT